MARTSEAAQAAETYKAALRRHFYYLHGTTAEHRQLAAGEDKVEATASTTTFAVGTAEWAATITADQAVELSGRDYRAWVRGRAMAAIVDGQRRTGWDFTPKSS